MSREFLEAIDARPHFTTETKKLPLPKGLRRGGRVNFIWTLVTFGLLAFEWQVGLLSAGAQAVWAVWLIRSPLGVARKNYMLGSHAAYAGKYREALELFQAALKEFPGMVEIYPILGDLYFKKGESRKGIEAYKKYLSKNPGDNVLRIKLLLILMGEGLYEEFLALLESLPHDLLEDFLLSILKSFALLQLDKPGQAQKVLAAIPESEVEGEGKDVPLNYLWGRVFLQKKDPGLARKHLRQVLEAREGFMDAESLLKKSS